MVYKQIGAAIALCCIAVSGVAAQTLGEACSGICFNVVSEKRGEGTLHCWLYSSKAGFPDNPEPAIKKQEIKDFGQDLQCVFSDLAAGTYAASFWYDEDNDEKLDSNFLGIPKEPVGASNNAEGSFGPPKFKKAAFEFDGLSLTQQIETK